MAKREGQTSEREQFWNRRDKCPCGFWIPNICNLYDNTYILQAILDSFPPANSTSLSDVPCSRNPRLVVVSTKNDMSLEEGVNNIKKYLTQSSVNVNDLAYTLGTRRDHMKHRAFAIIDQDGTVSDFEKSRETKSGIAFVFSGQGAQWAGMGRELLSASPSFCRSIWTMDQALKRLKSPPEWTLRGNFLSAIMSELPHSNARFR